MTRRPGARAITAGALTALLAERVMGWTIAPDRFLTGKRKWMPRWRFQPKKNLSDAFRVLKAAKTGQYSMGTDQIGGFWAKVRVGGVIGEARAAYLPAAISRALAKAVGLDVEEDPTPRGGPDR